MSMAESAVSLHPANPARQLVQENLPEGVLLSPAWKRAAAYILDVIFIMGLLMILTRGTFVAWLYSISGFLISPHIVILHWLILFAIHWLYFKYTGLWLSRSLGQRWFGIALVHHDATPLGPAHWGKRAFAKTRYAIPVFGQLGWGLYDYLRIRRNEQHRTSIDESNGTIAAVDWSLPPPTRAILR